MELVHPEQGQTKKSRPDDKDSNMNQISDFLESSSCPMCSATEYTVLKESSYPPGLPITELLKMYSSSSDRVLMDQMVQCLSCSLIYLNPRVHSKIIMQSYSNAVDPTFVQQNACRIQTFSRILGKIVKRHNIQPSKNIRILDVGCAGGAFPKAATDQGFSAEGVEPSLWMCEFGKKEYGLTLYPGTLHDQKFPNERYHLITLWDVIEHLTQPAEVLLEIRRILHKDGLLVVNFPDYDSLARKLLQSKWPFFLSVHLIYFTPKTIARLLSQCGFEVIETRPFWQTLPLGYILHRASAYFMPFKWIEKFVKFLGLADFPFTYNVGQTMVIAKPLPK